MYFYREDIDIEFWDVLMASFWFLILFSYAFIVKIRKIEKYPEYKYYVKGIVFKILGGIVFSLIYALYYKGGDTVLYFYSSRSLLNLAFEDFGKFVSIMLGNLSPENGSLFGPKIGYVSYYSDFNSFATVRFSVIFVLLSGKSFLGTAVLIAGFTYNGLWSLFRLLYNRFKGDSKAIAFAVLFIPSTLFWGSGIMKDSYTLMAICLIFVGFYRIIELKTNILKNMLIIIISSYILLSIKPYIFVTFMMAVFVTIVYKYYKDIKNKILKTTVVPLFLMIIIYFGINITIKISSTFNEQYSSIDKMLNVALISQQDLKQAYYGGNSFDIGDFEPTVWGVLSKFHLATLAGLYRPYLWDVRNIVMLISALENTIFLLLSLYVLILSMFTWQRYGWKYMQKVLFSDSFIVFSLVFSIVFAFFMGLTTSNFGSLVRYKIRLIPFFMASLLIIVHNFNIERNKWEK